MTYCVGMVLDEGLVMVSDSRTNAGVDHVATFRKMSVWSEPGERAIVLMAAGNLAITQAVVTWLNEDPGARGDDPSPRQDGDAGCTEGFGSVRQSRRCRSGC